MSDEVQKSFFYSLLFTSLLITFLCLVTSPRKCSVARHLDECIESGTSTSLMSARRITRKVTRFVSASVG